jgi:DNA-binding protein H-NS
MRRTPPEERNFLSASFIPRKTRLSLKELLERHQQLELQLVVAREREAETALTDMVRTMRQYGITVAELMGRKEGEAAPAAKYKNPETDATWSGRGRVPYWIAGKNREDFRV